VELHHGAPGGI